VRGAVISRPDKKIIKKLKKFIKKFEHVNFNAQFEDLNVKINPNLAPEF